MNMAKSFFRRLFLVMIGIVSSGTVVLGQSDICRQYRAELSNLERGGGGRNFAAMAEQQRRELNRMVGYYQSLECDRGRVFIFGPPPSAECVSARERIQAMEANYNQLVRQSSQASEERRRSLLAAIQRSCAAEQRPRSVMEGVFGREEPYVDPRSAQERREDRRGFSGRPICVRVCDGYFFPLATTGGNRDSAQQMCQAQCPATPTQLFFMAGDRELGRAVRSDGVPYTSLPNAFRYRTTFDETCSCRQQGQSWAEALIQAEQMLSGRGDVVVTDDLARELSLPREWRGTRNVQPPRVEASAAAGGAGNRDRGPVRIIGPDLVPPPNPM
jgi:hypothetical protein